jgi:hypothetical protein
MHAMNAQEGSEAVPSSLPEPPAEDLRVRPNSLGNLRPALLAKGLMEELRGLSKEDVAKIGISLLMGGEGELPLPKGASGVPKVEPTGSISHLKGQEWLDAYLKKLDDAGLLSPGAQAKQDALDALNEPPLEGPKTSKPLPEDEEPNAPRYRKGAKRVGVAKGFGPGHMANAREGQHVDLTKINSDTVPAVLTPREAVLNRNAAELAGRGKIEALNAEGNALARKGVDLAAGGMTSVKEKIMKSKPKQSKPQSGSPYVQAFQKLMPKGGAPVGYEQGVGGVPQAQRPMPGPMAPPSPQPRPQQNIYNGIGGGGLFPPRQTVGLATGTGSVPLPGPIGTPPQGEEAYGPPVNLTAPQIQRLSQQTGLSAGQIQGLMSAVQGIGGIGGAGSASDMGTAASIGAQGGISDIGYPPFVAPSANYDGNRGGWLGPYDPSFMIQHYAGGISSVPFR